MTARILGILVIGFVVILVISAIGVRKGKQNKARYYYSIQERRIPCGRILRREVLQHNDAWQKTVTLMSPEGQVLDVKTRTIEPEQCKRIQGGFFVPGLWQDCAISL